MKTIVVANHQFRGITTRSQFAAHIEDIVSNGVDERQP